ncbi:hypothetical protein NIES4071_36720 [Calothrix sp. NIES-4071]|nr:hypothetical protein NIES4071_36720 [Calothrix sp. NIES-4071]BAZ57991.1 hypothetical protein NIES4105_36650 [Calothrix sp. NIES-4105]
MNNTTDYLYNLLPVIYRQRDAENDYALRDLLQIITEQVNVVESDISQLYDNWFIETCQDWVVPYIGDLIAYKPVDEAGKPGDINTFQGQQRNKILIPRRELANTIRYRRRKGTLALLELLANDVAGWFARAVEFYKLLGWTQHLNHLQLEQGRTVDLRQSDALERLNSPFNFIAHTVDIRRIQSPYDQGRYNIPDVGVFIWRLKTYSVTKTPAYCLEEVRPNCYTFSVLGNDTPLYNVPQPETEPTHIAEEINLPVPLRRRVLEIDKHKFLETSESFYYGENKSFQIFLGTPAGTPFSWRPIPYSKIIPADLSEWQYQPPPDMVAVDPVLGRIVFPSRQLPKGGVWVSYQYAFSADIGGGEYNRTLLQPTTYTLYQVGKQEEFTTINDAFNHWQLDNQANPNEAKYRQAVIEITDSGVYTERFDLYLQANQTLQIRAANYKRPVIRLLDYQAETTDSLHVNLQSGSRFTLDGLLIVGRGVQIQREMPDFLLSTTPTNTEIPSPVKVTIRHSTLVPGWSLQCDCEPKRPTEPSLELYNLKGQVEITHSIIGSIQVDQDEVQTDPLTIHISDSIVDATHTEQEAIDAPGSAVAHAKLAIYRSTVFGKILTHSIKLAENSIFKGCITVARRQEGCMRFCYVTPNSRTPRRYNCQPDLVQQATSEDLKHVESDRVRPQFKSTRYGTPTYCQLANSCAEEIKRGADDESEMGVFHHLYQPQREANLRARLDEYSPSGMETGIIYAS